MAPADECLCGTATLIEQLAQTKDIPVTRVDIPAQLKGALFLVSDEHGVVPADDTDAAEADAATVAFFADGYRKASRPPLNDFLGRGLFNHLIPAPAASEGRFERFRSRTVLSP